VLFGELVADIPGVLVDAREAGALLPGLLVLLTALGYELRDATVLVVESCSGRAAEPILLVECSAKGSAFRLFPGTPGEVFAREGGDVVIEAMKDAGAASGD